MIQGDQGRQSLCNLSKEVTEFYVAQLKSENYQVREAAGMCCQELFEKVAIDFNKEPFQPYVHLFLQALIKVMKDPHWGARVQSCLALSALFQAYP